MEFNNWNGKKFNEVVTDFANFLDSVKEVYYKNKDVEEEMNKKQQDLLHDIELQDLKYHDVARIGKEIRNLRINRREYKNESMLAEPVKEFFKNHDGEKFIKDLRTLADDLQRSAYIVENQYYNRRSSIENISTIKKDSNKEDDNTTEGVIQLNRLLSGYCKNLETEVLTPSKDHVPSTVINAKMQLATRIDISSGKKFIRMLSENIEKFFRPSLQKINCTCRPSDYCINDEYNKKILNGQICIYTDSSLLYTLNVAIREGKNQDKDKSKKTKKKSRR